MPFDPTLPVANSPLQSAVMLDAVPQITGAELVRDPAPMQDVLSKFDELITALRRA